MILSIYQKMLKTFDLRNEEKKHLNQLAIPPIFLDVRQIWFVKAGKNIWVEQNGKSNFVRPFLIIKKIWNQIFWTYLTTWWRESNRYKTIPASSFFETKDQKEWSKLCLGHAKTIDIRRFLDHIGTCDAILFEEIKKTLIKIYF